ncbi:hypothetical protein EJF36_18515 [Bacillus sp. HMF5848]|uniref:DUF4350 domain-containing protein n=1 Tax=Bacillus sp. HMF5848 TaxID=2495421 RepID=UPI000F7AB932|nr:DUF4350 domain-containing protein [Bacillus sp. HMF5848]RSK28703.1 hypothetical protein EJF36_18515 [Bacillus sp. HMF5848]
MSRFLRKNRKWVSIAMIAMLLISLLPMQPFTANAAATDLFISEHIEGGSYNKAIEIYNGTGSTVDLSNYSVELYSNGDTAPKTTLALSGDLADGDVIVIAHPSANADILALAAYQDLVANFNGDDAVVLKKGIDNIDIVGTVGQAIQNTKDVTLIRKNSVTAGSLTFDLNDWVQESKDTISNLGSHTMDTSGTVIDDVYGGDDSVIDDVYGDSGSDDTAEPALIPIADARAADLGTEVAVEGVVTSTGTIFIQDETAGINLYNQTDSVAFTEGDLVKVIGTTAEYNGLREIKDFTVEVISSGNTLPTPQVVMITNVNEDVEGELIKLENVTIGTIDTGGNTSLTDVDGNTINIRKVPALTDIQEGNNVDVIAIVSEYKGTYQLHVRQASDVTLAEPIDYITIAEARTKAEDETVTVRGIVTSASGNIYIQDTTAGINLYGQSDDVELKEGDLVKVTGIIDDYNGLLEIKNFTVDNVVSEGNVLPTPQTVTIDQIGETVEGELIKLENVTIGAINPSGNTSLTDSNNQSINIRKVPTLTNILEGDLVNVVAIVSQYKETYQLFVRKADDVAAFAGPIQDPTVTAIEDAKALAKGADVTLQGVVTHAERDTIMYIQDETAGIQINTNGQNVDLTAYIEGDEVKLVGKMDLYNGEIQVKVEAVENITKLGTKAVPAPVVITLDQLDANQGKLVTVEMVKITDTSSQYSFKIEDSAKRSTSLYIAKADDFNATDYTVGEYYKITGIAAAYNSPQLKLRNGVDMVKQAAPETAKLPIVYNVKPAKMAAVTETLPTISGEIDPAEVAIDWTKVTLFVDGVDVTAQTTFNETDSTFSYTPAAELAIGEHQINVEVEDIAGAKNTYVSFFYIQELKADDAYNFYFGVPHAHTSFSDGKGTPADAYQMSYEQGLDYMVVTDHSNWLDGDDYISERKEFVEKVGSEWEQTKQMAAAFNAAHAGEFLALRGFEMTSSNWGHINVWNSNDYVEAKKTVTELNDFYNWLTTEENVVAAFNHPNWPSDSFNDLSYVPEIDHLMAMIEVGNGAPPYSYARAEEHFFKAMDNGWHVGAINGQDNHSTNWGVPDNLTAVVAEELTTESFLEALKNRRVYSTEARDTELKVKANGFWMGSTLDIEDGSDINFEISVKDLDNPIDEIQIITNGGNIVKSVKVGELTSYDWNPTITDGEGANWYVVKVIHTENLWTTASAIFTSGGELDVKLTGLDVNPDPSVPGSETELKATVSNMGVRPVENLEVTFYRGTVSAENLISTGTIEYISPGKKGTTSVTWIPEQSGQDKIIAVLTEIPNVTTVTEIQKSIKVVQSNNKKVLIDDAHNNADVPGSMNEFMELLRRNGYQAKINTDPITASLLADYDVLVVNAPDKNFTQDEITAINSWVQAGGSLMLASKSNFNFDNQKLNPVLEAIGSGIRINNDNVYEPNTSDKFSGGMKWSVYAYTMPSTISGLNDNLEAIRFFSGSSLVDENLGALTNDPATGLEILVAGNPTSYNYSVADGFYTYNEAIGTEDDPNQTSGPDGADIPIVAKEYVGEGRVIVAGRHFYSDYEIVNDVSNTSFTLTAMDWLADYDRIQPIGQVRETAEEGDIVTVKGVVTAPTGKFFDTVYIQDETGGISLFGSQGKDLPVGTVVIATGGVTFFEGEMELEYENFDMEILYVGPGTEIQPRDVSAQDVVDGTYNGQLVKLEGTLTEINDAGSFMLVNDGVTDAHILTDGYLPLGLERFDVGDYISVQGIASSGAAGNRIRVRFAEDLNFTTEKFSLTVMHTNDTHAHLDDVAKRITAVNEVRSEVVNSILLDAGDVFSGTLFFNLYEGLADVEFMNMMGYDAMVPGNHEFDKGPEVLANFIKAANFPIVSANINYTNESHLSDFYKDEIGNPGVANSIYPAVVLDVNGEKIGVFGLTTEETAILANPGENIIFENYLEKASETIGMLQTQGVNKIIALTHLGYKYDQILANEVEGIDIIVGGHSHTQLDAPTVFNVDSEPTIIVQASEYGELLGRLDVKFDTTGILTAWNEALLEVSTYTEDATAQARIAELAAPLEALKATIVGKTAVELNGERADVRSKETNLGNLIADAMLWKAQENGNATIAIQNGGGIRASIDAGEISLGEVLTTMPFGNTLVTLELTGAEVIEALENGVSKVEENAGRFPHVAGMKFSFDALQPAGSRVYDVQVETATGYEPIELTASYVVATNAYVADGGDGYTTFKTAKEDGRMTELFFVDYDVFTSYLDAVGEVNPQVEGRIIAAPMNSVEIELTVDPISTQSTKVTGTATPGTTVTAKAGDVVLGTATVQQDGTYEIVIPAQENQAQIVVIAEDINGNSKEVTTTVDGIDECFIATAAFGTKFHSQVTLLRNFRDQVLLTNALGAKFVDFYYEVSPPIAQAIADNAFLKGAVRVMLAPAVGVVYGIFHPGAGAVVVLMILALTAFVYRRKLIKL